MSSVLVSCGICGAAVRFPGGQAAPAGTVCEKPECQAALAAQVAANNQPKAEPVVKEKRGRVGR